MEEQTEDETTPPSPRVDAQSLSSTIATSPTSLVKDMETHLFARLHGGIANPDDLARYARALVENGFDSPSNLRDLLRREHLPMLGVTKIGHIAAFERYLSRGSETTAPPDSRETTSPHTTSSSSFSQQRLIDGAISLREEVANAVARLAGGDRASLKTHVTESAHRAIEVANTARDRAMEQLDFYFYKDREDLMGLLFEGVDFVGIDVLAGDLRGESNARGGVLHLENVNGTG